LFVPTGFDYIIGLLAIAMLVFTASYQWCNQMP
jgi:hypothetical protein